MCNAGEVKLPYGSPEYVGLGFSVFSMIILVEIFGSPFLRNCAVIIGLFFGCERRPASVPAGVMHCFASAA
jgi:NCS2 family nucleobase:cation symporter-2